MTLLTRKCSKGRKFNGILYLHRITDPRLDSTSRKNLRLFRELCGGDRLDNVRIVTTNWGHIDERVGSDREAGLARGAFKPLVDTGAVMIRQDMESESAVSVISQLIHRKLARMRIRGELHAGTAFGFTKEEQEQRARDEAIQAEAARLTLRRHLEDVEAARRIWEIEERRRVGEKEKRRAQEYEKQRRFHEMGGVRSVWEMEAARRTCEEALEATPAEDHQKMREMMMRATQHQKTLAIAQAAQEAQKGGHQDQLRQRGGGQVSLVHGVAGTIRAVAHIAVGAASGVDPDER